MRRNQWSLSRVYWDGWRCVSVFLSQVLSQYDEAKKDGPKLTLGDDGEATAGVSTGEGGEGGGKKVVESLVVETKDASEYYTTEEMAKFKKPKKVNEAAWFCGRRCGYRGRGISRRTCMGR